MIDAIDFLYRTDLIKKSKEIFNKAISVKIDHIGELVAESLKIIQKTYNINLISIDENLPIATDNAFIYKQGKLAHCTLDEKTLFIQTNLIVNCFNQVNEISVTFIYDYNTSNILTYKYEDIIEYGYNELRPKILIELSDELHKLRYGKGQDHDQKLLS